MWKTRNQLNSTRETIWELEETNVRRFGGYLDTFFKVEGITVDLEGCEYYSNIFQIN